MLLIVLLLFFVVLYWMLILMLRLWFILRWLLLCIVSEVIVRLSFFGGFVLILVVLFNFERWVVRCVVCCGLMVLFLIWSWWCVGCGVFGCCCLLVCLWWLWLLDLWWLFLCLLKLFFGWGCCFLKVIVLLFFRFGLLRMVVVMWLMFGIMIVGVFFCEWWRWLVFFVWRSVMYVLVMKCVGIGLLRCWCLDFIWWKCCFIWVECLLLMMSDFWF